MHELSITQSILDIVLEKASAAKAGRISRVNIVIGELSGIVAESVEFYFEIISKDTMAAGASLAFQHVPTRLRCRKCGTAYPPHGLDWTCPACREMNTEIVSGRECHVESIEVE